MSVWRRVGLARTRLGRVLAGQSTPATDPLYFDDELALQDIAVLERHDLAWLTAALARPSVSEAMRRWIVAALQHPESRRLAGGAARR